METMLKGKEILITGGTGSLAKALIKELEHYEPYGIRLFSRDELKQWHLKRKVKNYKNKISFLVGDIRDRKRIELAMSGVDIVIHTAALKQVPSCEFNPLEAINTNIMGSQNVLYAALENKVDKVLAISTDKAVYPVNLYGATKMCAEKLFIQGNTYSGGRNPHFSCCRYGNVINSRGSVIPLFKEQAASGIVTVTHKDMTRFFITLEDVAKFILKSLSIMTGGEIFVPRMASAKIVDVAMAVAPGCEIEEIGIRPGEKMHEVLITKEEFATFSDYLSGYILAGSEEHPVHSVPYTSDGNSEWLTKEQIIEMAKVFS